MGLEKNGAALLLKMWKEKNRFGRFLTLGRQNLHLDWDDYSILAKRLNIPFSGEIPSYMDDVAKAMGATEVEAMDFSGYEGASVIHDLNKPIPNSWHESYDTVFDGGSLVFNFPVAISNCMNLIRAGGNFVMVNMANNWCGHGFYQFSPELFFRIFSPANGFSVVELYLATLDGKAYLVRDPEAIKARVELCNDKPVLILLHARRARVVSIFESYPQQSDYVQLWQASRGATRRHRYGHLKSYRIFRFLSRLRRRMYAQAEISSKKLTNSTCYTPTGLGLRD
jgi:hypothetical protein